MLTRPRTRLPRIPRAATAARFSVNPRRRTQSMSARPDRSRVKGAALLVLVALLAALVLSACGGGSSSRSSSSESPTEAETEAEGSAGGSENEGEAETAAAGGENAYCGPEGITLGIQDGGGLNSWSKES